MSQAYNLRTNKTVHDTEMDLSETFRAWGVTDWAVEFNVPRARALANQQRVSYAQTERSVTVRWMPRGSDREVVLTMNRQRTIADNLRTLYLGIEAMRLNEKRGIGDVMQSAYLQLAAPPTERDPYEVLGLRPGAGRDEIEAMYRVKAKQLHPDHGGTDEDMAQLNAARARALEAVPA